jgi:phospholipid N-methyltransferase
VNDELSRPFDSIESAQEFMELLEQTIDEARLEIEHTLLHAKKERDPRRAEAIDLAIYKLGQLSTHTKKSRRILNDLRTIRRLLIAERAENAAGHR